MATALLCLSGIYAGALPAQSGASPFPSRPIDLFVGSAPSGSTDALGRVLARALEDELGQPVVVHNTPGAGGAVMATQLRSSVPDGYSIGMNISHAYTGNPVVMPNVTTYSVNDFSHLASVSKGQCALVTSTQKPYETFDDLITAARAGEQPVFASQSPLTRIVVDYVSQADNVRFRVMTVQGGGEIMQSILGGHADFGFSGGPHISFVEAGQMRVLASVENERLLSSPDVPTLKELGYDMSACSTFVVSAPPGLPENIRQILAAALQQAIASAPMQTLIRNLKYPEYFLGPEEVTRALEIEAAMLERAVTRIDIIANGNGSTEVSTLFMPIVALFIGFIGTAFLLVALVRNNATERHFWLLAPHSWFFVGLSIAVMLAGFSIMWLFGYLPGAAVIVSGFMILSKARLRYIIGCAIALPGVLWLLFSKLLGFPLP